MNKKYYLWIAVVLLIAAILIVVLGRKYDKEDVPKLGNDKLEVITENEPDYIDDNEEIVYNDDTSKYDINHEYTDASFKVYLKKMEYKDNRYIFTVNFMNINEEVASISYNRMSCEVNKQSVDVGKSDTISIEPKKNKDLVIECVSSKDDEVNVVYKSILYNGHEPIVKFGKRS